VRLLRLQALQHGALEVAGLGDGEDLRVVEEASGLLASPRPHRALIRGSHRRGSLLSWPGPRAAEQPYHRAIGDDGSEPRFDGRRAHLEDEVLAVTVGYQAGDAVGLGVEEAVDVGVYAEGFAVVLALSMRFRSQAPPNASSSRLKIQSEISLPGL